MCPSSSIPVPPEGVYINSSLIMRGVCERVTLFPPSILPPILKKNSPGGGVRLELCSPSPYYITSTLPPSIKWLCAHVMYHLQNWRILIKPFLRQRWAITTSYLRAMWRFDYPGAISTEENASPSGKLRPGWLAIRIPALLLAHCIFLQRCMHAWTE